MIEWQQASSSRPEQVVDCPAELFLAAGVLRRVDRG
jgi:hypothetical protein